MNIGFRIKYIRKLKRLTQKELGLKLGFPEDAADVRIAQYESGSRTPKENIINKLADALGVVPQALTVPDIDSYTGLMHTLFTLEDRYGLEVCERHGEVYLRVNASKGADAAQLHEMICAWRKAAAMFEVGKITRDEYDRGRYTYQAHQR